LKRQNGTLKIQERVYTNRERGFFVTVT